MTNENNNEGYFGGPVGYRNPPKRTQFKEGKSGNPSGKKNKPPKTFNELINQDLESKITVYTPDGKKVVKTKEELIAHQIVNGAAKGDIKMITLLSKLSISNAEYEYTELDRDSIKSILDQFISSEDEK